MAQEFDTSTYTPPEQPRKSNTTIIIIIVVAVLLLCCCCLVLVLGWNYGDILLNELDMMSFSPAVLPLL